MVKEKFDKFKLIPFIFGVLGLITYGIGNPLGEDYIMTQGTTSPGFFLAMIFFSIAGLFAFLEAMFYIISYFGKDDEKEAK